jgi:hypothetical protein
VVTASDKHEKKECLTGTSASKAESADDPVLPSQGVFSLESRNQRRKELGYMPTWRRFIIEQAKDTEDHRASQFILCKEHFPMLLRLVFCVWFCVRPADYFAVISAEIHVKAEHNLNAPASQRNSVFGKIVWKSNWLSSGWTLVPGVLEDYGCVPSQVFVSFSDIGQSAKSMNEDFVRPNVRRAVRQTLPVYCSRLNFSTCNFRQFCPVTNSLDLRLKG